MEVLDHNFFDNFFDCYFKFTFSDRSHVFLRISNRCANFSVTAKFKFSDGSIVESSNFDSVVKINGSNRMELFRASTFNKIRKKDGFYDQFTEMLRYPSPVKYLNRAIRNMEIAEKMYASVKLSRKL